MTTTLTDARRGARDRYVHDVLSVQEGLRLDRFGDLATGVGALHLARRPNGWTTAALRGDQLPYRYLLAIQGFRLARFIDLGWASRDVVYEQALFHEPPTRGREEIHVLTVDGASGRLLAYASMLGAADAPATPHTAPDRSPFPCEEAHGVRVLADAPVTGTFTTDEAWEVKRLTRHPGVTGRTDQIRLVFEVVLGLYSAMDRLTPRPRVLVGDVEPKVALRHLTLTSPRVVLVEGTEPKLPGDSLIHPAYEVRGQVLPFVAEVPGPRRMAGLLDRLERVATGTDVLAALRELGTWTSCRLERKR
ncbi:hypothetical protein ABZ234_14285 [Nocardiopsis sp. NPDC006198]|uniref:hypothetical protein n=1 Tax=Nocardiopsis sp. NPDC006198 TaxID=3154472 RepID=UPI0033B229F8